MALRIWQIKAANEKIEKLEADLSALTKERDELKATLESNSSEVSTQAEQLQEHLSQAESKVASLEGELSSLKADAELKVKEIAALTEKLANKDAEVEEKVSRRLAEAQAALGQPPKPVATPAGVAEKVEINGLNRAINAFAEQLKKSN